MVTCRNPDLLNYSFLVFKTIRIGFPTYPIKVWFNGDSQHRPLVDEICKENDLELADIQTTHYEWIEGLYQSSMEPFWICDTDIIFYDSVEGFTSKSGIAGWRIPQWKDEFTGCTTRSRLHTCLLYINPVALKFEVENYWRRFNHYPAINPSASLFQPITVPFNGEPYFYDVASVLYHAVGGDSFTDQIKNAFFHFNFGTISDKVLPKLKDGERMRIAREEILNKPDLGRGAWRWQEEYYAQHQPIYDGKKIEDTMSPEDIQLAREWNVALCCGNQDAMMFCDLWHRYCHAIDDLIDTMEDGRPVMDRDQIIGTFLKAAVLYNSAFFVAYRNLLFPIVVDITNVYMMSVQWEKAPQPHLRKMGDIFRTCGNRIYSMVALITGGEQHMVTMSRKITERDYLSQHDENDQPK